MGEPIKMRIRDGCRGGSEQFTWTSIKEQTFKDRECYLGQSTKVGMMGKFGRYYVHDWFAKKRDTADSINSELKSVKAYEEELMQEALGLKPKKLMLAKKQLTEEEIKEFLKRDEEKNADQKGHEVMGPQKKIVTNEYGEQIATSNEEYIAVAAREAPIKGIGFAAHRTAKLEDIKNKTLGTVSELEGVVIVKQEAGIKGEVKLEVKEELEAGGGSSSSGAVPHFKEEKREVKEEQMEPSPKRRRLDDSEERRQRKQAKKLNKEDKKEKKRKKAEKKLRKAEKKLRKQEKKERVAREVAHRAAAKKSKRSSSGSGSSSSSSA